MRNKMTIVILLLAVIAAGGYAYTRNYSGRWKLPETEAPPPKEPEPPPQPPADIPQQPATPPDTVLAWYFTRNAEHRTPGYPAEAKNILARYNAFYVGDTSEKKLFLTFDEGYENGYTASILDTLKANGVKAAFFITDSYLNANEALVERMLREGHTVGNHSVRHPQFPTLTDAEVKSEVTVLNDHFRAATGQRMRYFRFPEGAYSERTVKIVDSLGYKIIFWSLAYKDWDVNDQKGAQYAYDQVLPNLHNGAIILLHAVSESNAGGLDKIIKDAKAQGYSFATLDELHK